MSPLYALERFDIGIVYLDVERRVVGMNDLARRTLPVEELRPFDRHVLGLHPERSRPKVAFLLDQAAVCPVANPPPMTMIINIPERVLLIKVSRLSDGQAGPSGYVLVFHDITEIVSGELPVKSEEANQPRRLMKIPTASGNQVVLVDVGDVLHLHSDGHYTRVVTAEENRFCNLSISDIETRLDPQRFMRVHRSHIVNLGAIQALVREGGRLVIQLDDGTRTVPVSRTSAADLLARLGMTPTEGSARRQGSLADDT
ncbi:PAS domain-containing transcriptional regulator [Variovorax sp. dw_954]|uniref:LytTR family transcriptional regulator n=1 Tax=Variovorax sp. dw_954 TaxID=2720078 RepID=UPI001BD27B26|nr:PAS domain-containing transcriptional regulator [Variovorax sp. dw_954]